MTAEQAVSFVTTALAQSNNIVSVELSGAKVVKVTADFRQRDTALQEKLSLTAKNLKSSSQNEFSLVVVPYEGVQVVESNYGRSKVPDMRVVTAVGQNPPD